VLAGAHARLPIYLLPLVILVGQGVGYRALTAIGMPDPGLHPVFRFDNETTYSPFPSHALVTVGKLGLTGRTRRGSAGVR
jgi:hypothetical protein